MTNTKQKHTTNFQWSLAGLLTTPIRWVVGWLFFSAFWRRAVLAPIKLDPNSPAYAGHKFNHFLPHALGIKSLLEYLIVHPTFLYIFLVTFTIIECLVGLALLLGFATRLASLGIVLLSWGILMGSGWLGTTCLDEWQIGAMGVAGGLVLLLTGSGPWSLDAVWQKKWPNAAKKKWLVYLTSGELETGKVKKVTMVFSLFAIVLTLFTNQAFFSGVWGKPHNPSKQPHITLSNLSLQKSGDLKLNIYRDGGPDTYGAFIIDIKVKNSEGKIVEDFSSDVLAKIPASNIKNQYLNKIQPTQYALLAPLGAKATISLSSTMNQPIDEDQYSILLTDVSGIQWKGTTTVK